MDSEQTSYVVKRDGSRALFQFDKITDRLMVIASEFGLRCDVQLVVQRVVAGMVSGITTAELDMMASKIATDMGSTCPEFLALGKHVYVSNMHKTTFPTFSEAMHQMHTHGNVSSAFMSDVEENRAALNDMIIHGNDHNYDIVGLKTLVRSYLGATQNGIVIERPQYMLMRIAVSLWGRDLNAIRECYLSMSAREYTHATPTCFNAGRPRGANLSSCFLLTIDDDSIEGIAETWKKCASISKGAGGIGIAITKIRARGSPIRGTNGKSNGTTPMLKVFESIAKYVDQGGGKRKGSVAVYMEPWHADIEEFVALRYHDGMESQRLHDLFTALWIPDIFMRRLEANDTWTLFCPTDAPKLLETWGDEFDTWYVHYEKTVPESRKRVVHTSSLFGMVTKSAFESGMPYMVYKDRANATSNQQNLGVINCSNLCTEIIQYSSPTEVACCNLASIALQRFVRPGSQFDFDALGKTVSIVIKSLDRVVDCTDYPIKEAMTSNFKHRPLGLGVQGLANVFMEMRIPFDSDKARMLNIDIAACMYWHAVKTSVDIAEEYGSYPSFEGSPASKGKFQFDLWGVTPSQKYDWEWLRERMVRIGLRNSLLRSDMPTASTATFLGSVECTEPLPSNFYAREALAGDFIHVNKYLVSDLRALGMWDKEMRVSIDKAGGSIQNIVGIPQDIKALYKTRWEISPRVVLQYAADRGPYICQSQSTNVYLSDPTYAKYAGVVRLGWKLGLITGIYYLHTKSTRITTRMAIENTVRTDNAPACKRVKEGENEVCESCSS